MRRIMTAFGSGWQGMDAGYSVKASPAGTSSHILTMMKGEEEVGYLTYSLHNTGVASISSTALFSGFRGKGHGKELYMEAMRHAKAQGASIFRSDIKGTVSESAQRVWQSAERAGVAQEISKGSGWFADLSKLAKAHAPSIEGLSEHGVASLVRKVITSFGSGWIGCTNMMPQPIAEPKTNHYTNYTQTVDENSISHTLGVHNAKRQIGKVEAIEFNSQPNIWHMTETDMGSHAGRGLVSNAYTDLANRARRAGAELRFGKAIMKSGEGAAIAKAGTAEVPAILKVTARVMKNAL